MCKRVTVLEWEAVVRMLRAGMRRVEIARELELGVDAVERIAGDLRRGREMATESDLPDDDAPPGYVASNLRRCAGCGAMVYLWPCLACRMATTERLAIEAEDELEDEEEDVLAELIGGSEW